MTKPDSYNPIIFKEIVRTSYSMTIDEQRILFACISQINNHGIKETPASCSLSFEQMQHMCESETDQQYTFRKMSAASKKLFQRNISITLTDNKEISTRFVQSMKLDPENKKILFYFAENIIPYLTKLEENFTRYRLQNMVQLTSSYAICLYELLLGWSEQNQYSKNLEIDELRTFLKIEDKYKQFSELKRFVINPALAEINKNTPFNLEINFQKDRRAYKWLLLEFGKANHSETGEETATNAIKESNTSISIMLAAIPDGTKYVTKIGNEYEKRGDQFESDCGVIQATDAFEMIKIGDMRPMRKISNHK